MALTMRLLVVVVLSVCLLEASAGEKESPGDVLEEAKSVNQNLTEKMEELGLYLSETVRLVRGIEAKFMQTYWRQRGIKSNKTSFQSYDVTAGAVFTRWGNDTCTEETELAYHGFTASGHTGNKGGGSNMLCVHSVPQFERTFPGNTSKYDYLCGAEYENIWRADLTNQDVPCAVCRSQTRSSAIMVPGRHECMEGWHTEYWGFLVSGKHDDQSKGEYVCLDSDPDTIEGGFVSTDGKTLYNVKAYCGSLPCPPYKQDYFVPCVVCTK